MTATTHANLPTASGPPAGTGATRRSFGARLWDRVVDADAGFNHVRSGVTVLTVVLAIIGVEWLFVGQTHAFQVDTHGVRLPSAKAAEVGFANHAAIVAASLSGVSAGLLTFVALADRRPRRILVTLLLMAAAVSGGLAFGLAFDRHHQDVGLASIVVVLTLSVYLRRFGTVGTAAGVALFAGTFSGRQDAPHEGLGDFGWIIGEIFLGLATALVVLVVGFRPHPARAFRQLKRSYGARSRHALTAAADLLDHKVTRWRTRRMHRSLVRLNEVALSMDTQLGEAGSVADGSAMRVHQRLFDLEVATTNVARTSHDLATSDASPADRAAAAATLHRLAVADPTADGTAATASEPVGTLALDTAFAESVRALGSALDAWYDVDRTALDDDMEFVAPAPLRGTAVVSAAASRESLEGSRRQDRIRLAPWTRGSIQMFVASTIAVVAGHALSSQHFVWALIAVFLTFMGTNTAGEQVGKAVSRAAGTGVGIVVGGLLAHVVGPGHDHVSLVVLLIGLLWAFTLMQVNYAVAVIGITVMVSQLYLQLGEFSDSLLGMRFKETLLGAGIAVATTLLVLPLRTTRVLAHSLADYRQALTAVTGHVTAILDGRAPGEASLDQQIRTLDREYQTLLATARPARRRASRLAGIEADRIVAVTSKSHSDSRLLVATMRRAIDPGNPRRSTDAVAARRDIATINTAMAAV